MKKIFNVADPQFWYTVHHLALLLTLEVAVVLVYAATTGLLGRDNPLDPLAAVAYTTVAIRMLYRFTIRQVARRQQQQ